VRIEHEFFGDDAFTEMARKGHRHADRFAVEDRVRRLTEQLMPLLDRTNRMLIRNLKAIKELRQGQVPAVAIGRADHVTVTNRPNVRLRPVKTELPHAVSDPCSENLRGDLRYHRYHRGSARYPAGRHRFGPGTSIWRRGPTARVRVYGPQPWLDKTWWPGQIKELAPFRSYPFGGPGGGAGMVGTQTHW
jgi:hypothetical protein